MYFMSKLCTNAQKEDWEDKGESSEGEKEKFHHDETSLENAYSVECVLGIFHRHPLMGKTPSEVIC